MVSRPWQGMLLAPVALVVACSDEADPRPQLVVWIDTDLPTVGQLVDHPELSADAAVDTLRIDVLGADGLPRNTLTVLAPNPTDWPVSFGVAAGSAPTVRLRARVFRSDYAKLSEWGGQQLLEPAPMITVDRVLEIVLPAEGIQGALTVLSGDCLGIVPSFVGPITTCVDGDHSAVPIADGVHPVDLSAGVSTRVGTWPGATEVPCLGAVDAERACVPGGYSLLGVDGLEGITDGALYPFDPVPLRPVVLSPFLMDRTELTVGRWRALLASQPDILPTSEQPRLPDPGSVGLQWCTYAGPDDAAHDDYPLSCLGLAAAEQICAALGGSLPTEAQWEHAARGRGQHRWYSWGDEAPHCCSAVLSRGEDCQGAGPAAVGSTSMSECEGLADISRDGVLDLVGNVHEIMRDDLVAYDDGCWAVAGVLRDPVCLEDGVEARAGRGASWRAPLERGLVSLRPKILKDPNDWTGFRCVYPALP